MDERNRRPLLLSPDEVRSDAIPEMVRRIVDKFQPVRIILFGSDARGDENRHSDVNLLVVLPSIQDDHRTALSIHRELAEMPGPKEIVVTTPEELARRGDLLGTVLRPALREGKILYERPSSGLGNSSLDAL
jgi:predicted nucleotidyltransferase